MNAIFNTAFAVVVVVLAAVYPIFAAALAASNLDAGTIHVLRGTGVTSLHVLDLKAAGNIKTRACFAGTKRGTIQPYLLSNTLPEPLEELNDPTSSKFPVFSITSCPIDGCIGSFQLICGGGNRYISIWKSSKEGILEFSQKLGPHTGWVKDVACDSQRNVIHSIGCNCIESWEQSGDGSVISWCHAKKRSIESCPNQGSTLSSDLLSLCMDEDTDSLYAGGVDGRIHTWSLDVSIQNPLQTIGAHTGRVNLLMLAPKARMLFSAGHDGTLQCRLVHRGNFLTEKPAATVDIMDDSGKKSRIMSAVCVRDVDGVSVEVVLGTANGVLRRVSAKNVDETNVSMTISDSQVLLDGEPMIHAISTLPSSHKQSEYKAGDPHFVLVGHASGMTSVKI